MTKEQLEELINLNYRIKRLPDVLAIIEEMRKSIGDNTYGMVRVQLETTNGCRGFISDDDIKPELTDMLDKAKTRLEKELTAAKQEFDNIQLNGLNE